MNFGMKNAPSTFAIFINNAFGSLIGEIVGVYLDEILVYSQNYKDLLGHLQVTLDVLIKQNLVPKSSKCNFLKDELPFLGHIIS